MLRDVFIDLLILFSIICFCNYTSLSHRIICMILLPPIYALILIFMILLQAAYIYIVLCSHVHWIYILYAFERKQVCFFIYELTSKKFCFIFDKNKTAIKGRILGSWCIHLSTVINILNILADTPHP